MEGQRFDQLARFLTLGLSRRNVIGRLRSGFPVALSLAFGDGGANGKKKRKKRKQCRPKCDGSCVNGVCVCPSGLRSCGGACQQCCADRHCEHGRSCLQGVCACPRGHAPCPNECCGLFETCEVGQCAAPAPPVCDGFASPCTSDGTCCSGACLSVLGLMYCARSELGQPCSIDDDCVEGASCFAYHCFG